MKNMEMSQLGQIIESRSRKEHVIGGEYIAFMGAILIGVYAFNAFVFSGWWVWLVGVGIGWVGILIFEYLKERKSGKYSTRIQSEIYAIWIAIGGVVAPLVLVIFPGYFNLYDGKAVCPLMYLISGLGVWLTGTVAKSNEFRLGAGACIIGTFLSIFYNSGIQQMVIFNAVMVAGYIVPGMVSKYNEKRG